MVSNKYSALPNVAVEAEDDAMATGADGDGHVRAFRAGVRRPPRPDGRPVPTHHEVRASRCNWYVALRGVVAVAILYAVLRVGISLGKSMSGSGAPHAGPEPPVAGDTIGAVGQTATPPPTQIPSVQIPPHAVPTPEPTPQPTAEPKVTSNPSPEADDSDSDSQVKATTQPSPAAGTDDDASFDTDPEDAQKTLQPSPAAPAGESTTQNPIVQNPTTGTPAPVAGPVEAVVVVTEPPTTLDVEPIAGNRKPLSDDLFPRVPPVDPYVLAQISDVAVKAWMTTEQGLISLNMSATTLDADHETFCKAAVKRESEEIGSVMAMDFGAVIAPSSPGDALPFTIASARRHVEEVLRSLCRYYKPIKGWCDLSAGALPRRALSSNVKAEEVHAFEESMRLYAWKFGRKIVYQEKLVVGVVGTSVFAGQDNCYNRTFAPVLGRSLSRLLGGMGVKVEVRNSAANGDGPEQFATLACMHSLFNFDELDIVNTFWSMLPNVEARSSEVMVRKLLMGTKRLILTTAHTDPSNLASKRSKYSNRYLGAGHVISSPSDKKPDLRRDSSRMPIDRNSYPWWRKASHWGRHGDERCHLQTREGFDGVLNQNWHPGPLGSQIYADVAVFYYAQAVAMALDQLEIFLTRDKLSLQQLKERYAAEPAVALPTPLYFKLENCLTVKTCGASHSIVYPGFCATGQRELAMPEFDIKAWRVSDDDNPFPETHEGQAGAWDYLKIKNRCNARGAKDVDRKTFSKDTACLAKDEGFGFRSKQEGSWITFRVPETQGGFLAFCTIALKGHRSPYSHSASTIVAKTVVLVDNVNASIGSSTPRWVQSNSKLCIRVTGAIPVGKEYLVSIRAPKSNFDIATIIAY